MSANTSLSMFRGDGKTFVFTLSITENGVTRPLTPGELTAVTVRFTAKRNAGDPDAAAVIALDNLTPAGGVVVDPLASLATVTIPPASTAALPTFMAALVYDLQVTAAADGIPHTLVVDQLSVNADVRRAAP